MKVWVMQGSYEGELFSSVHFTEKGCALACIADVLEFLGVEDSDTAQAVTGHDEPFEWDYDKMKEKKSKDLWKIFSDWTGISWDRMSDRAYYIDAQPMEIQG